MLPAGDQDEVELLITSAGDQDEVELVITRHQQAVSSVLYTTSCKHSLVLLRMSEIIARNMLN